MRAMSRAKRGGGFRGVLDYAITREGKAQKGVIVGGNMSGANPRELSAEFGAVRKLRPDIAKPVSHNSLRLPAGEKLAPEQWRELGDEFMREMGFSDANQCVYVLHDDIDGQHIHIIANRISESGKIWLGKNENLQATKICDRLERKYGLSITTPDRQDKEAQEQTKTRRPTAGEIQKTKRTGKQSPRVRIQKIIDKSLKNGVTVEILIKEIEGQGVVVHKNIASTGKINGFAFELDGVKFKGSDLGKAYTLAGLQKRGLVLAPTRNKNKATIMNTLYNDAAELTEYQRRQMEAINLDGWWKALKNDKVIYKKDGLLMEDKGNELVVSGEDLEMLARSSVELAIKKGWRLEDIRVNGTDEFKKLVEDEIKRRQELQKEEEKNKLTLGDVVEKIDDAVDAVQKAEDIKEVLEGEKSGIDLALEGLEAMAMGKHKHEHDGVKKIILDEALDAIKDHVGVNPVSGGVTLDDAVAFVSKGAKTGLGLK